MVRYHIAYLPGDGIGPEVLASARSLLDEAGLSAEYVAALVGWDEWRRRGDPLPQDTLEVLRGTDCCLFGAITSKTEKEAAAELSAEAERANPDARYRSPIVRIRQEMGLAVNVRPAKTLAAVEGKPHVDLTIFRENSEGLYSGVEWGPVPDHVLRLLADEPDFAPWAKTKGSDLAVGLRILSRRGMERLLTAAFDHAEERSLDKVTLAEKPNVLRRTGGLALEVAEEVASGYKGIRLEVAHVDSLAMNLVLRPEAYRVIAATNLFGDILSDVAAATVGGLGTVPSANLGNDYALFEPVHGSAPDIAGQGIANPVAAILSAAMMAHWLGEREVSVLLEEAVAAALAEGISTPDLGGEATTASFTDACRTYIEAAR